MSPGDPDRARALSERWLGPLRSTLDAYQRRAVRVPERRKAAVMIPLFERDGRPWVVLTRRTDQVRTHKGQISFPGGTHDAGDEDLWATAVRETHEELGLDPSAATHVGTLDDYPTFASGFIVTAFVASIEPPDAWRPSEVEIDEVIELPLAGLAEIGRVEMWEREGIRFPMSIFELDGHYVWGVTAFILRRFLDVIGPALGYPTPIGGTAG